MVILKLYFIIYYIYIYYCIIFEIQKDVLQLIDDLVLKYMPCAEHEMILFTRSFN